MSALAWLSPFLSALTMALIFACSPEAPVETLKSGPSGSTMRQSSPASDREALTALFNAMNGESWDNNGNWLSSEPIGDWYGVLADAEGRVVELHLHGNLLRGEIPRELGDLDRLQSLGLGFNQLTGPIPPELGSLVSLRELSFRFNQLTGEIPPELGNLINLQLMTLSNNRLTGEVPPELGNLASLRDLHLHNNRLSGEIPPELGNLTGLGRMLSFDSNCLSGKVPPELGNLASLTELGLSNNRLTGEVPPELGNLASLKLLFLDRNQFVGCVPAGLQDQLLEGSALGDLPYCR